MYNISYQILRNHYDAEEAVSQTFLKIMNHIERISVLPQSKIEPFCIIILKNETMNIIRQGKKKVYMEDLDYLDSYSQSIDPDEEYIKTADKEKIVSCINSLSDTEKYLIYLRFVNELSFKHIAELLGITEEAAKKRSQRILKKLRLLYEGDMNGKCI